MSENTKNDWNNDILGGLWIRKSSKGNTYLTGTINGEKIMVFKTKQKKSEKSPDYIVYKSNPPEENREPRSSNYSPKQAPTRKPAYRKPAPQRQPVGETAPDYTSDDSEIF